MLGRHAGSAQNRQPWRFCSSKRVPKSRNDWLRPSTNPGNVRGAQLIVAIVGRSGFDTGRAAQNMLSPPGTRASALARRGLEEPDQAHGALGLGNEEQLAIVLTFGYPARDRDPLRHTAEESSNSQIESRSIRLKMERRSRESSNHQACRFIALPESRPASRIVLTTSSGSSRSRYSRTSRRLAIASQVSITLHRRLARCRSSPMPSGPTSPSAPARSRTPSPSSCTTARSANDHWPKLRERAARAPARPLRRRARRRRRPRPHDPRLERDGLPGGVDDVLERGFGGGAREEPDVLCALVAIVDRRRQGEGLSALLIEGMRRVAARAGLACADRARSARPGRRTTR